MPRKRIDTLTGVANSGKSSLFAMAEAALPGVIAKIQPAGEFSSKGGGFTPLAAQMETAFIVWADETDKGADFSKPGATHIYADDQLSVHLKHQNARMAQRNANLWLVGNAKPSLDVAQAGGATRFSWVGRVDGAGLSDEDGQVIRAKLLEPDALALLSTLLLEMGLDEDPADTEATQAAAADWQEEWADPEVAVLRDEFESDPDSFIPTAALVECVKDANGEVSKLQFFAKKVRVAFPELTNPVLLRVDGKPTRGWRLRRRKDTGTPGDFL